MSDERKRLSFDPTINAGHVLTVVAMLVTVAASYSLLDKRVGVLEEKAVTDRNISAETKSEQREALKELRSDVKDLQRSVNDIGRAVAAGAKR